MRITVTSISVTDQEQALQFYTEKLGSIKKQDIPLGEARWLTLVSPEDENGLELLLEPNGEYRHEGTKSRPGRRWDPLHYV